jgi:hypothetical protein
MLPAEQLLRVVSGVRVKVVLHRAQNAALNLADRWHEFRAQTEISSDFFPMDA